MRLLSATIAVFACLAWPLPAMAQSGAHEPQLDLNIQATPNDVNIGGSLTIKELDAFGLITLENSVVKVINSGQTIIISTTIPLDQSDDLRISLLIQDQGLRLVAETVNNGAGK